MSLLAQLRSKPWQHETVPVAEKIVPQGAKRVALRFFLVMISVFFSLFLVTFLSRSQYPDFQALAGQPWQPLSDRTQLWFNTLLLLFASLSLEASQRAIRQNKSTQSMAWLAFSLLMSVQFLLAQVAVWQTLQQLGFYSTTNPANSFYYLLTGLHGAHLIGGIAVVILALLKFGRQGKVLDYETSVALCITYWHYLFVLWLVLFALLSSSAETFRTIAVICGYG